MFKGCVMRVSACLVGILALVAPGPTSAQSCGPSAHLSGGHTIAMAGVSQEYTQTMVLVREGGGGLYGNWIGVEYVQDIHNSIPMPPEIMSAMAQTPDEYMLGVEAVCDTAVPDAHTVTVTCRGRYPFTVHPGGAITWQGQSTRIGTLYPDTDGSGATMRIDLLTGAPGYSQQGVVDGSMAGQVSMGSPYQLQPVISGRVSGQSGGIAYTDLRIDLDVDPLRPGATLIAIVYGPQVTALTADPDSVIVRLYGNTAAQRRTAAATTVLTGTLPDPTCPVTRSWYLGDLLQSTGTAP